MAVSGGYNGALQWMLAHGWTKADLDKFLAGNPGDWGRVDSAFGNDSPHSVAAQVDQVHAAPGVIFPAQVVSPPMLAHETLPVYAPATPNGAAPQLMSSPGDGLITASAMLPAVASPGNAPISVNVSGQQAPAPSAGIPIWIYAVGAGLVLLLLIRR